MKNITFIILLTTLSMAVLSRPTIGPPSINLRSNLANIAVVELHSTNTENYLFFKKIKDIHNKADDTVSIKSNKLIAEALELNKKYIIGYSSVQSNRRPVKVSPRKGGAIFINLVGASPAIYAYSKDLETILNWNIDESLTSPKEILPIILRNIDHFDAQIQNFFITELITRKNIYKHLTKVDYEKIIKVLEQSSTPDTARHLMLSYSSLLDKHLSPIRLCGILTNILNNSDVNFDIYSLKPALISRALVKVRGCKQQLNLQDLSRWLFSNNTGIIEKALDSIKILNPDSYFDDLNKILNTTLINTKTKTTINTYKKRMMRGKK